MLNVPPAVIHQPRSQNPYCTTVDTLPTATYTWVYGLSALAPVENSANMLNSSLHREVNETLLPIPQDDLNAPERACQSLLSALKTVRNCFGNG